MKVTINVDCSPEEARTFMGLPDLKPMQESLLKEIEIQMRANMQAMSPEAMMKTWLPATLQNAGELQKMFGAQFQNMMTGMAGPKQT
jgi:hypothetical protein